MAQLDRHGECEYAEYAMAYTERLLAGQLSEGEILTLYLRIEHRNEAYKAPVQIRSLGRDLGALGLDVSILDEDLKPIRGFDNRTGIIMDGVWNETSPTNRLTYSDGNGGSTPMTDGVFRPYDDGLDLRLFEEELVGVGVRTVHDVGSFRL